MKSIYGYERMNQHYLILKPGAYELFKKVSIVNIKTELGNTLKAIENQLM